MRDMSIWDRAVSAALGEKTDEIPVVLMVYAPVLKEFVGVKEYEYYHSAELQVEAKVAFQRRFPKVINIGMGTFPEHGEFVGPIPTAFGGKLRWMEDQPPYVEEYLIKSPEDVDRIAESGLPDSDAGVAQEVLKMLEYFSERFPRDLRDEYGYVDGVVCPGACIEGAALSMGYDKFLTWMYRHPDALHKWLKISTDWYLEYCKAIEEVVGDCKVLWVADHTSYMVGKNKFLEFILPYINKVFNNYKKAFRIWHNEGKVGHILAEVNKINAEVWQFGPYDDVVQCRNKTHFCLQGNLHPPNLLKHTPKEVEEECHELIKELWPSKFWLSTGGGMSPGTPFQNIDAIVKAAKKHS
jgi:uroporphyrinogen-III decarboxylase